MGRIKVTQAPDQASLELWVVWVKLLTHSAHEIHLPNGK